MSELIYISTRPKKQIALKRAFSNQTKSSASKRLKPLHPPSLSAAKLTYNAPEQHLHCTDCNFLLYEEDIRFCTTCNDKVTCTNCSTLCKHCQRVVCQDCTKLHSSLPSGKFLTLGTTIGSTQIASTIQRKHTSSSEIRCQDCGVCQECELLKFCAVENCCLSTCVDCEDNDRNDRTQAVCELCDSWLCSLHHNSQTTSHTIRCNQCETNYKCSGFETPNHTSRCSGCLEIVCQKTHGSFRECLYCEEEFCCACFKEYPGKFCSAHCAKRHKRKVQKAQRKKQNKKQ